VRRLKKDLDVTRDRLLAIQETLQQEIADYEAAEAEAEAEATAVEAEPEIPAEEEVRPASYGRQASRGSETRRPAPRPVEHEEYDVRDVRDEMLSDEEVLPEEDYVEEEVLVGRRSSPQRREPVTRRPQGETQRTASEEFGATQRKRADVNSRLARSYSTLADEAEAELGEVPLEEERPREVARKPSRPAPATTRIDGSRDDTPRPQRSVEAVEEVDEEAVVAQTRPTVVRKTASSTRLPTRKPSR
jgi:hypothetical protein